jgi:tryptophan halogenase
MTRVLIVGGGTAGWMTAAYLSKALPGVSVRLVESAAVKKIGVGEATFSTIRHFFDFLGLDEREWLPRCGGGYKLGIRFANWNGDGSSFFHPFERWRTVRGSSLGEWWLAQQDRGPFDQATFVTPSICAALRAPRGFDGTAYDGLAVRDLGASTMMEQRDQFPYAYHFDADKVAEFLAGYATTRGVERLIDSVTEVKATADQSAITGVVTAEHGELTADLYIDCTGFRSLLLGAALGVPFESFADVLPNNRAVALRTPRADREVMEPFTTATTMSSGWRWTIPLYERNGYGYVYCDEFQTPEEAEAELRASIPVDTDDLTASHIRMRIGRSERSWQGNCVAIGLASAFVEPLESTGIFFIQHGIEELVRHFPGEVISDQLRDEYNRRVFHVVEGVKTFLALHFLAAKRNDSPYWQAVKTRTAPDALEPILRQAEETLLDEKTIYPHYHGFESYSWNTMLLGLRAAPTRPRPSITLQPGDAANHEFDAVAADARRAVAALPSCFEYLDHIAGKTEPARKS